MPRASVRAVEAAIEWKKFPYQIPDLAYFTLPDRIRLLVAQLVGGHPDEIALTTGASGGLWITAAGLEWKPTDQVLVGRGDFAAHLATWAPLAQGGRLQLKIVSPRGRFLTAEDFVTLIGPRTKLVSVSLVQPYDSAALNAAHLAAACHEVGAFLLLDVSQAVGAMPLDVRSLDADFVVAAGYKWLLGPYGTGFFWIRRELISAMCPSPVYWKALKAASNLEDLSNASVEFASDASRWDAPETSSFFNLSALVCSLELLLRAGVKTIWDHNQHLMGNR